MRSKGSCIHRLYYFILSGANESLAYSELKALFEIYGLVIHRAYLHTQTVLIESDVSELDTLVKIINRSGMIREGGYVLWVGDKFDPDNLTRSLRDNVNFPKWDNYWIESRCIRGLSCKDIIRQLRMVITNCLGLRVSPRSYNVIQVIGIEGFYIIGVRIAGAPTKEYYLRRPSTRPFFRSIALPVNLSRTLINLSRARQNYVFLDPFCGTGSILVEASLMGLRVLGIDINWEMVRGSRENLRNYSLNLPVIVASDALKLPIPDNSVDAIATDPPYGRAASTYGEKVKDIYKGFLKEAYRVLRRRRYLVFMAPSWLSKYVENLLCRYGFILSGRHHMYVHGGLTRIIYVVYRG